MAQRQWLLAAPAVLLLGLGGRVLMCPIGSRGADHRIVAPNFPALERKVGYHLYAPTWLPHGGHAGITGAMIGEKRVLQDFSDDQDRSLLFVAQERRVPERDGYHKRLFQERAEATAQINGRSGYFVTGTTGERRLFWNEPDMAVILSSSMLTDEELVQIARKVR